MTVGDIGHWAKRRGIAFFERAGRAGAAMNPTPVLRARQTRLVLFLLVVAFMVVLLWDTIIVSLHAGEQGVYWSRFFGGTSDEILGEGTHLKFPWDDIFIYNMRVTELHDQTVLLTKDGMDISVRWSVRYHPRSGGLPLLHRTVGPLYAEKIIVPEVTSTLREVLGNYNAEEIYVSDEKDLLSNLKERLRFHLADYPIAPDAILITELELPQQLSDGIVKKLLYEQKLLSYRFRLQEAEQERERKQVEAEGIKAFEQISGISILKWQGLNATVDLAKSPNTKIIIMGTDSKQLPLLLNTDK